MPEKITLINEKGESTQSDIISIFKVNGKKFIITTNNEVDPNGLTVLNISEVDGDKLNSVTNDSDWDAVKNIMRSIISGTDGTKVEYEPILSIANINSTSSFRYISVSNSAVLAMVNDYSSNKPVGDTSNSEPVVSITNAPSANAFNNLEGDLQSSGLPENNAIYPQQNMNAVDNQNAIQVANGINMVQQIPNQNSVDFEPVKDLANPIDLMAGGQPVNTFNNNQNEIPNIGTNNVNMNFNTLPENASSEEIRQIAIDNITAIVTNYVDAIAQKEMETVNQIRLENERKQQELLAQEELIKSKLMGMQSNPYNFQQQMTPQMPNMNMMNPAMQPQPQMAMPMGQMGMDTNMYQNQPMMNQGVAQGIPDMNMMNGVAQTQPQMAMPINQMGMDTNIYQNQGMVNQGMAQGIPDMNSMNGVIPQDQTAA